MSNTVPHAEASSAVTITIISDDLSGKQISGVWTALRYTNGTTISQGYTPVSFQAALGPTYVVHVGNYQNTVFNHWMDGNTSSYYTFTPSQNTNLTAYFSTSGPSPVVPSAPQGLQASGGNAQIVLSWTAPSSNGGSAITGYKVYRSTASGAESLLTTIGNLTSYDDNSVTGGQTYFYKVSAVNSIGESLKSNEASASTKATSTTTHVTISVNSADLCANPITGLGTVIRYANGTTITSSYTPASFNVVTGTAYVVHVYDYGSDVFNHWSNGNTTSYYTITPTQNATLTAYYSTGSTCTGPTPTAPGAPTGPTATATSSSQINLSWTAPSSNGGSAITGYKIERSADNGASWSTIQPNTGTTSTTYSDTGLAASTAYAYRVSAINSAGTSSPSNTATATTQSAVTAPGVPRGLSATPGNSQVTLSWNAPLANGGSPITNYKIYRSTSSGTEAILTTVGNVTSFTDSGLTNGIKYYYKVTAVNSVGESAQSGEAGATPATVPVTSTGLRATPVSSSKINLSWTPPSNNGGSPITGYEIERAQGNLSFGPFSNSSGTLFFSYANMTSFNDTGLASSTTYNYTVFAKNSAGPSAHSNTASATTFTVPSAPQNLQATSASSSQVNLSWTAPSNNGGSPITGYKIERSPDNTNWSTMASNTGTTSTTYSDTGLATSTAYYYRVSAINSVGTGSPSSTSTAATRAAQPQPGSPSSLSTSAISYSKIGLSWATPSYTGTSPITGYEIYRSDDNGRTWDIVVYNTSSPSTSYTDTGLNQATTYLYMISAINSKGISQSSNTTSATTQVAPSGPPAVTTGILEPLYCAPYGTDVSHCTTGSSTDCNIYPNNFCWQPIINAHLAHPHVSFFVIINPDNGPCRTSNNPCDYNSDYANGIGNLTQNGIVVLGYVKTHYANSTFSSTCCTFAEVQQNVTQWANMYKPHGLQGINFDEMSNTLGPDDGNLTFYQNLATYARSLGFSYVIGNPGTATIPQYLYGNTSNAFTIYEGSGQPNSTRLTGGDLIGTALSFDRKNFAFVSFCQTALPGPSVVGNQSNFVGFMYYTDVGGSCTPSDTDPWDRISSYLSSLASDLDRPASTVTIDTVDLEGRPISGYPVEVSQNGTDVPSGYSSLSYLSTVGATYTFTPDGYNKCSFDHWNDNLSDKAARAVRVTQADDQLTAVFSGPGCP